MRAAPAGILVLLFATWTLPAKAEHRRVEVGERNAYELYVPDGYTGETA